MSPVQVLALVATYLVHSTLLGVAAWGFHRVVRSARAREIAWRTALFGALFTTGAQVSLGAGPWAERWALPFAGEAEAAALDELGAVDLALLAEAAARAPIRLEPPPSPIDWGALALRGWLFAALGSLAWTVLAVVAWKRRLGNREALRDGPIVDEVRALARRAGLRGRVRVTVSRTLEAPVALGVLRPEISLPPRALALPPALRSAMLAHELAHLARRDPLWLGLARVVEVVFFFQPLHRLAGRRLRECAEFLCDDRALLCTGDRVGLARCLAEVAGWLVGEGEPAPACAMADARSPFGQRVQRILDEGRPPESGRGPLALAGVIAVAGTAWVAPSFAVTSGAEPPTAETTRDAAFVPPVDDLERQLAALAAEVVDLQAVAADRVLTAETHARIERVATWVAAAQAKERQIRELVALVARQTPDDDDGSR